MVWVLGLDPSDDPILARAANEAAIGPDALDRSRQPEGKSALREATAEAVSRGVPGAPTFFVNGMLFWGQDRLAFVEKALDGWRAPVDREEP
jgi:2-hydroxychromene-2-carboxylate isomerase